MTEQPARVVNTTARAFFGVTMQQADNVADRLKESNQLLEVCTLAAISTEIREALAKDCLSQIERNEDALRAYQTAAQRVNP